MLTLELFFVLLIGAILICIPISIQMKWYRVERWKSIVVSVAIIITGLLAAELWFFLENGFWAGKSFFGAVFFAPLTFIFVSKLLKIPYVYALDFCATAGCFILGILKIQCLVEGCCAGIVLYVNEAHMYVRFPSQLVEFISALILGIVLLVLSRNTKYRGLIYPWTLVLYGALRFILNLFRDDWGRAEEMNLLLPLGNIWSLIAIVAGGIWLGLDKKKHNIV